jgi:L-amino acid N-acyltransferase YncA
MTVRYEYALDLSTLDRLDEPADVAGLHLRSARPDDLNDLAELMLDAYRGTIDYDDETLEDSIAEVQAYLDGRRGGSPWLDASRLGFVEDKLVCACLVGEWRERQRPIISYIMTRADWKGRGVSKQALFAALQALAAQGHDEVLAVITDGNTPSERLFARMGFKRVGSIS